MCGGHHEHRGRGFRGFCRRGFADRETRAAGVAVPLQCTSPVQAVGGDGATITDVDGNTFLDFTGGVGCLNVGHSHPHAVAAATEQLEKSPHTDYTIVPYEVYATLSERL